MMKVIIKYFLPLCRLLFLTGCDDQNFMHQKYLDEGERVYPGMADSVEYSAGNERVRFSWFLNADPRIDRSVFYWNEGKDSAVIPTNRTHAGILADTAILNITEGTYTFSLVTKDKENNKSLSVERTVQIYGPTYISRLTNRGQSSSSFDDGTLTVNWAAVESALIQYSTVYYTDYSNPGNPVAKSIRVEIEDTRTVIEGVRKGDSFSISTTYLPAGGLDNLESQPVEYVIM
jgi:hypothetical protein